LKILWLKEKSSGNGIVPDSVRNLGAQKLVNVGVRSGHLEKPDWFKISENVLENLSRKLQECGLSEEMAIEMEA
jgi:hypothetical protein